MADSSERRRAEDHPIGAQIRAARALLNMSAAELASRAGLALNTVKRAESTDGLSPITAANASLIVKTLNDEGIELLPKGGGSGEGVRFASPRQAGTDTSGS